MLVVCGTLQLPALPAGELAVCNCHCCCQPLAPEHAVCPGWTAVHLPCSHQLTSRLCTNAPPWPVPTPGACTHVLHRLPCCCACCLQVLRADWHASRVSSSKPVLHRAVLSGTKQIIPKGVQAACLRATAGCCWNQTGGPAGSAVATGAVCWLQPALVICNIISTTMMTGRQWDALGSRQAHWLASGCHRSGRTHQPRTAFEV
jgi:hypothetical protein